MIKKILTALLGLAMTVSAAERVLYDGAQGLSPGDQGWALITTPLFNNSVMESVGSGDVNLNTTAVITDSGGYFSNLFAPPILLDRQVGYTLKWRAQLLQENHANNDRAGLSILVVCDDLMALELGTWVDEIWAQNDNPLFTHGEGAALDTQSSYVDYALQVSGATYSLSANEVEILSGDLRDYTAFDHVAAGLPQDPYETNNMIFIGDNTTSASTEFLLESVVLVTPEPLVFTDAGGLDDLTIRLNGAGDTIQILDSDDNVVDSSPLAETLNVVIDGQAGDDTLVVDFVNGSPVPDGGLSFNGGTETIGDTLVITNGTFGPVVHTGTTGSSGTLDLDGDTVTYVGLEPVDMSGSTATELNLNLPATDDLMVWSLVSGTTNLIKSGDAPVTFESTQFVRPADLVIDGGDGRDVLLVTNNLANARLDVKVEQVILTGNLPYNRGVITTDELRVNPTNTLAGATLSLGALATTRVSGDVILGGNLPANNFKGAVNQNGAVSGNISRMLIGGDLIFGGSTNAGVEGGTYNLNQGELVVTGSVVETVESIDEAQFQLNGGSADIRGDITVQRFALGQAATGDFTYTIPTNQSVRTTGTLAVGAQGKGALIYTNTASSLDATNVMIGEGGAGSGTVTLDNGLIWNVRQWLRIGHNGTGTVNLVSGTINVNAIDGNPRGLRISENPGSEGTLVMGSPGGSGTADPIVNNFNVNFETSDAGKGVVMMHHGTVNQLNGGNIIVGQASGAEGTFTMMDGLVNIPAANLRVGNTGTGTFEQVSGEVIVGEAIDLGNAGAALGSYRIQDGSIKARNLIPGNIAQGFFTQDDGDIRVAVSLIVGNAATSQGAYIMNDGSLVSSNSAIVGRSGEGLLIQNGGDLKTHNDLWIGDAAGGTGTYEMNGGALITTNRLLVGSTGEGHFTLGQGTLDIGTLMYVGNAVGGQGTFVMTNGTLTVGARVSGDLIIGNNNTNITTGTVRIEGGTVDLSRGIRLADNGIQSSGTLIVGTADGSNSPIINMQTGSGNNFETADNGTGVVQFHSGVITMNNNNFITGQALGSDATVTIGGGAAEARLDITGGNGLRDWNTNAGQGIVNILSNGVVNVGRNINLGNNTNATCGLELTINGGTLRLGRTTGQNGDLSFRAGGPLDQVNLLDGELISSGGTFQLSDATTTNFNFSGGMMANFATFANGHLTQDGGLLRIGDTNVIRILTMNGVNDYIQNAGVLEIDIAGTGGAGATNGHDQIFMNNGDVRLAGSLVVHAVALGAATNEYTIIDVNHLRPVMGEFDGLPEGEMLMAGGNAFTISYVGGTGNDVVLSPLTADEISARQPVREPGGVRLFFNGLPNTLYTIQWTPNELPLDWQDITDVMSEADGSFDYLHAPTTDAEFYRAVR